MIRNFLTLLAHDLAVAFKSKTLYLVLCIPIFVYATLKLVDSSDARTARMKIALLHAEAYTPAFLDGIQRVPDQLELLWAASDEDATALLKKREVDGIVAPDRSDARRLQVTVVQQASVETLAILQRLSALQSAVEGGGPAWIASVRPLQTSSMQRQTLPTWIVMMVLLVGFIVLPAQVAEEKEKQLFLGWMQTPVRESDWLMGKLAYGITLTLASVAVLHLLSGEPSGTHAMGYAALLCAGGFCFGALGICLGLLCRSQASARTLGVIVYLPLLLPAALSDVSQQLRSVLPFVPSYQLYEPLRAMLVENSGLGPYAGAWLILTAFGLLACLASHRLLKRRWLM